MLVCDKRVVHFGEPRSTCVAMMLGGDNHSTMPGGFNSHETYTTGRRSNVFRPPQTPSASSSSYLAQPAAQPTMTDGYQPLVVNRKRPRQDADTSRKPAPVSHTKGWSNGLDTGDTIASIDLVSPMPFVNTRYQLAGGIDQETGSAANYFEESEFSDTGYRRNLSNGSGRRPHFDTEYHSFARLPSSASFETNGKPLLTAEQTPRSQGWSKAALSVVGGVVGGVVGRVWQFCKAGAFSGFAAGGGQQFQLDPYHTVEAEIDNPENSEIWDHDITKRATMFEDISGRAPTPLPGQYPNDIDGSPYVVDRRGLATPEGTPPRAAKRRQIEPESSEGGIGKSWVVVPSPTISKSPIRQARYSMPTTSSASRHVHNNQSSTASRPTGRAGMRRTLLNSRPSGVSHAGSPALRSSAPASYASPRSPGGSRIPVPIGSKTSSVAQQPSSPAAIEAQKWASKKRKEDQEADKSMRRLNAQLQAMIREGKEALGTKFEVHDVDDTAMKDTVADGDFQKDPFSQTAKSRRR